MSVPPKVVRSTYRTLLKHATILDRSPAHRALLSTDQCETPCQGVDDFIKQANNGSLLYLPPFVAPLATGARPRNRFALGPLGLDVRKRYESCTASPEALHDAFAAIKMLTEFPPVAASPPMLPPLPPDSAPDFAKLVPLEGSTLPIVNPTTTAVLVAVHPILRDLSFSGSAVMLMSDSIGVNINIPVYFDDTVMTGAGFAAITGSKFSILAKRLANNVVFLGTSPEDEDEHLSLLHTLPDTDSPQIAPGVFITAEDGFDKLEAAMDACNYDPRKAMILFGRVFMKRDFQARVQQKMWIPLRRDVNPANPADVADVQRLILSCNKVIDRRDGASVKAPPKHVLADPALTWCRVVGGINPEYRDLTRLVVPGP